MRGYIAFQAEATSRLTVWLDRRPYAPSRMPAKGLILSESPYHGRESHSTPGFFTDTAFTHIDEIRTGCKTTTLEPHTEEKRSKVCSSCTIPHAHESSKRTSEVKYGPVSSRGGTKRFACGRPGPYGRGPRHLPGHPSPNSPPEAPNALAGPPRQSCRARVVFEACEAQSGS